MNTKTFIAGAVIASALAPFAAFAQATQTTPAPKSKTDFGCVQVAIDKREDGISAAWSTYSTAVSAALAARKTALHTAWGLSTSKDRQSGRNEAWTAYRSSLKTAKSGLTSTRSAAWNVFSADTKACKVPVAGEGKASDQL